MGWSARSRIFLASQSILRSCHASTSSCWVTVVSQHSPADLFFLTIVTNGKRSCEDNKKALPRIACVVERPLPSNWTLSMESPRIARESRLSHFKWSPSESAGKGQLGSLWLQSSNYSVDHASSLRWLVALSCCRRTMRRRWFHLKRRKVRTGT